MKSKFSSRVAAMTLVAFLLPIPLAAQDRQDHHHNQARYSLTILDTLGGMSSGAQGINNRGQAAGWSWLKGNTANQAALWTNGEITGFGALQAGVNSATFTNPNEMGEVSGMSNTQTPDPNGEDFCFFGSGLICLGFLWRDGVIACQINNRGQVVGVAETPTTDPTCPASYLEAKPVVWEESSVLTACTWVAGTQVYSA